jgi:hypothetical protein
MPLYTFVNELPELYIAAHPDEPESVPWTLLQQALVHSELSGRTWILRPAVISALDVIHKAWRSKKIAGAFLYSNNGSEVLVKFVQYLLNGLIGTLYNERNPYVFKMGIHLNAPCRTPGSLDKTFKDIQACLEAHDLPPASSAADLMFFDDLEHVLASEIPNYVQVRPYHNHTSINVLVEVFDFMKSYVGDAAFRKVAEQAARDQMGDLKARDNTYVLTAPTAEERRADLTQFREAFQRFFARATQTGGRTRSRRDGRRRRASKNKWVK